jgi:hypothetical protein
VSSAPFTKASFHVARPAIVAGAIVVVLAAIVVNRFVSDPGGSLPAKVDEAASALPATIGRDAAIAIVMARGFDLGRVDRSDAKLLTMEEYLAIAGPLKSPQGDPKATPDGVPGSMRSGFIGDPAKRYLWAVAISGEVWPVGRIPVRWGFPYTPPTPTPFPSYRWGLFLVDAVGASMYGISDAGSDQSWPAIFEKLPNHPATTYVAPGPTPAITPLDAPLRSPEALSLILRRTTEVRRIDRIEMKLMTWAEYLSGAPAATQRPAGAPNGGPVWIYAVSGDILSSFGISGRAPQPVPWAIFAIDATTSEVNAFGATDPAHWPYFFGGLPDHPRAGGP